MARRLASRSMYLARTKLIRWGSVEIDQTFASMTEWSGWVASNPGVYRAGDAAIIARRIVRTGFREPLTGRIVTPREISAPDTNWREGLAANGLISRHRAVLDLIAAATVDRNRYDVRIFATEAVTQFALLLRGMFPRFLGSEYGYDEAAREALYPIPHQDLTALDLPSGRFDIVTTNEVLEHVPDLDAALREIARVLKPGGLHIGTFPFWFTRETGDVRARLVDGQVLHVQEPEYHGNPVDPDGGSLVFETPGWDILPRARAAGFTEASMRFVASQSKGYITENTGIFVFYARR
nr:class I SAM-dependent methyltransferase [uncultured Rhodopila sp.]